VLKRRLRFFNFARARFTVISPQVAPLSSRASRTPSAVSGRSAVRSRRRQSRSQRVRWCLPSEAGGVGNSDTSSVHPPASVMTASVCGQPRRTSARARRACASRNASKAARSVSADGAKPEKGQGRRERKKGG
jgi:hypothetical protein